MRDLPAIICHRRSVYHKIHISHQPERRDELVSSHLFQTVAGCLPMEYLGRDKLVPPFRLTRSTSKLRPRDQGNLVGRVHLDLMQEPYALLAGLAEEFLTVRTGCNQRLSMIDPGNDRCP